MDETENTTSSANFIDGMGNTDSIISASFSGEDNNNNCLNINENKAFVISERSESKKLAEGYIQFWNIAERFV